MQLFNRGNQNVVFIEKDGSHVLRVRKKEIQQKVTSYHYNDLKSSKNPIGVSKESGDCAQTYFKDNSISSEMNYSFFETVLKRYIPSDYFLESTMRILSDSLMSQLKELYKKQHPDQNEIIEFDSVAIRMRNATNFQHILSSDSVIPTSESLKYFCLELKPKLAYSFAEYLTGNIPSDEKDSSICDKIDPQKCPQKFFCSLDLFSGCPIRISFALKRMWKNSVKLLKFFSDGIELPIDEKVESHLDIFTAILLDDCMKHPSSNVHHLFSVKNETNGFQWIRCSCEGSCGKDDCLNNPEICGCRNVKHSGGILGLIRTLQSIENSNDFAVFNLCSQLSADEKTEIYRFLLNEPCQKEYYWKTYIPYAHRHSDETSKNFDKIADYLFSKIFRDCSIMISYTFCGGSQNILPPDSISSLKFGDKTCLYQIKLIDTDMKNPRNMEFYSLHHHYHHKLDLIH